MWQVLNPKLGIVDDDKTSDIKDVPLVMWLYSADDVLYHPQNYIFRIFKVSRNGICERIIIITSAVPIQNVPVQSRQITCPVVLLLAAFL